MNFLDSPTPEKVRVQIVATFPAMSAGGANDLAERANNVLASLLEGNGGSYEVHLLADVEASTLADAEQAHSQSQAENCP